MSRKIAEPAPVPARIPRHSSGPCLLKGITDRALARNVRLGPRLHVQTWSHQLAALDADKRPVLAARMRAIYKLRQRQGAP